jgi:hypothetical protein
MFWSKSDFFKQTPFDLQREKQNIVSLLEIRDLKHIISGFLEAYDYFVANPTEYDGATIVKDLHDIKGLDLSAMMHDFNYIVELPNYRGFSWLKAKIKFDWLYGKNMEMLGKGITIPYSRSIGLIISTPIYWVYKKVK